MNNVRGMTVNWEQPSHPGLVQVSKKPGRGSRAISLVSLAAGSHFAPMTAASPCEEKSWTSVQYKLDGSSIELNSDLVYCNHSCRPTLVFDMSKFEVRVADDRPLEIGDELTFSYNSTEWDQMEPFECECLATKGLRCGERIAGAKNANATSLKQYWLNAHIEALLATERPEIWYTLREESSEAKPGNACEPAVRRKDGKLSNDQGQCS